MIDVYKTVFWISDMRSNSIISQIVIDGDVTSLVSQIETTKGFSQFSFVAGPLTEENVTALHEGVKSEAASNEANKETMNLVESLVAHKEHLRNYGWRLESVLNDKEIDEETRQHRLHLLARQLKGN